MAVPARPAPEKLGSRGGRKRQNMAEGKGRKKRNPNMITVEEARQVEAWTVAKVERALNLFMRRLRVRLRTTSTEPLSEEQLREMINRVAQAPVAELDKMLAEGHFDEMLKVVRAQGKGKKGKGAGPAK